MQCSSSNKIPPTAAANFATAASGGNQINTNDQNVNGIGGEESDSDEFDNAIMTDRDDKNDAGAVQANRETSQGIPMGNLRY